MFFLNETWIAKKETLNLDIIGYKAYHIYGTKVKQNSRGRFSGGISVYFKTEFAKYVSIVESIDNGILWIKISGQLFNFKTDVYICHVYIPPSDSKILKTNDFDFYDEIEKSILKYELLGKVFISGDFNARSSDSCDFLFLINI